MLHIETGKRAPFESTTLIQKRERFAAKILKDITLFFIVTKIHSHVSWVLCHYSMARPQVVNEGDGFQIWRVVANISNKQSWTADKGWSSSMGVGRGTDNSSP
jgi:hypothetical protein